jgi:hypothetical protein
MATQGRDVVRPPAVRAFPEASSQGRRAHLSEPSIGLMIRADLLREPGRARKGGMTDAKPSLKAKALLEFVRFATMFAYLWVMFFLLQLHQ